MSAMNGVPEGQRVLTADEVRSELQRMKLTKNYQPERIAQPGTDPTRWNDHICPRTQISWIGAETVGGVAARC